MKTKYSVITKFPCTKNLAESLIESMDEFIKSNNPLSCAEEIYVRTNIEDCDFKGQEEKYDSAWILECLPNQQYHWHSSKDDDIYYSLRRILFVADDGLNLSFFKDDGTSIIHERIICNGPTFLELKFDGKTVHRFRPNNGKLYAYSFHYKDFSAEESTLETQSYIFKKPIPSISNEIFL